MQEYIKPRSATFPEWMRLIAYYTQRLVTSRRIRRAANFMLLFVLRARYTDSRIVNTKDYKNSTILKDSGIVRLTEILSETQCSEIRAYLFKENIVDQRGTGQEFTLDAIPNNCRLGDYSLETVVNCPYVMQAANLPELLRLATNYLGFAPTITSLSIRWSFPTHSAPDEVQNFHRDCEVGSFKVLIYLTDVDDQSGPHTFVDGSHRERMPVRLRPYPDDEVYKSYKKVTSVVGRAGTSIAIDTKGIHKGGVPTANPRLILGIQYSLLPCFIFRYSPIEYLGNVRLDKHVNRLIVRNG